MTSDQLEEALSLTVGGIGIAFGALIMLALLMVAVRLVLETRFVQARTGALVAQEAAAVQEDRAKAAGIAVSVALAEEEASRQDSPEKYTNG